MHISNSLIHFKSTLISFLSIHFNRLREYIGSLSFFLVLAFLLFQPFTTFVNAQDNYKREGLRTNIFFKNCPSDVSRQGFTGAEAYLVSTAIGLLVKGGISLAEHLAEDRVATLEDSGLANFYELRNGTNKPEYFINESEACFAVVVSEGSALVENPTIDQTKAITRIGHYTDSFRQQELVLLYEGEIVLAEEKRAFQIRPISLYRSKAINSRGNAGNNELALTLTFSGAELESEEFAAHAFTWPEETDQAQSQSTVGKLVLTTDIPESVMSKPLPLPKKTRNLRQAALASLTLQHELRNSLCSYIESSANNPRIVRCGAIRVEVNDPCPANEDDHGIGVFNGESYRVCGGEPALDLFTCPSGQDRYFIYSPRKSESDIEAALKAALPPTNNSDALVLEGASSFCEEFRPSEHSLHAATDFTAPYRHSRSAQNEFLDSVLESDTPETGREIVWQEQLEVIAGMREANRNIQELSRSIIGLQSIRKNNKDGRYRLTVTLQETREGSRIAEFIASALRENEDAITTALNEEFNPDEIARIEEEEAEELQQLWASYRAAVLKVKSAEFDADAATSAKERVLANAAAFEAKIEANELADTLGIALPYVADPLSAGN